MSNKKTIFDLYRENDANFSTEPSSDAWSKLEAKLDGENSRAVKPGGRIFNMSFLSIAAGMLILVGIGAFLVLQNGNHSLATEKSLAVNDSKNHFLVEDLDLSDSYSGFSSEKQVADEYRARFAGFKKSDNAAFAEKESKVADVSKSIRPRRINQKPGEMIAFYDDSNQRAIPEDVTDRIEKDLMENLSNESIVTSDASLKRTKTRASFETDMVKELPETNSRFKSDLSVPSNRSINSLNWLVGSWEQELSGMKSVEKWVSDTFNTISGTGYLVQGDDTIFTETPTIKQIGDKIYFFQNIDRIETRVPYELMVQSDSQWIFENSNPAYPESVILTRGSKEFEFEVRDISKKNNFLLKRRNHFSPNSAKRNMVRMN